ncbi:hypothetical protein AB4305_28220 [Nocardia sp. 2YAB30]|uniref:hypothetical protein n=1 Tax=Nocardia sp. 2YAB30 TaxID=3233022 RepID=UPI003F9743B2
MRTRAYGIVRCDRSGRQTAVHVAEIRTLAQRNDFDLREIFVRNSDADFGILLATLSTSGVVALVVPSVVHITGWLDAMRQDADVWTLIPLGRWPRHPVPGS